MERISLTQLFVLTSFFQIGTTIIFGFGNAAGRDAWIVTIISTALGLAAIIIYLLLMYLNPGLTLVEWFQNQLGKWIGTPIAWLYPLLAIYEMARGINDVKFLMSTLILKDTPMLPILVIFILIITYSQKCGIEVLARVGEFIFPIFILLFTIIVFFVTGSGMIKTENLQPVLETGWAPIWKVSFPLCASQGFAQTLEVAMIWPLVSADKKDIAKTTILATLVSGAVIFITQLMIITGLDGYSYKAGNYPMYILISKISIGGFIQHLDVFGVLFFIISAFFKVSLHMFFSIRGIQLLTNTGNARPIIILIALLSVYLGYSVSLNFQEHILVAFKIFPYNLWFPLLWVIPIALLIYTLARKAIMRVKNT